MRTPTAYRVTLRTLVDGKHHSTVLALTPDFTLATERYTHTDLTKLPPPAELLLERIAGSHLPAVLARRTARHPHADTRTKFFFNG